MKLSELYAREFEPGGENICMTCNKGRKCHGSKCAFCIRDDLRASGVSRTTLEWTSTVLRRRVDIKQAVEAIDREIK